ncbi:uncharacterized protein LOC110841931 [Folsomia candida]|uniref:Chitin-binding type-4 domain-containing protein n=1 Tax=Folsomia candida TaxID=158441 RepID=A0A226EV19_FOLCA|nr:uncharacterized protein LOC110841931 [Folsomia candida]OXA61453.1 hypothetical protein Fcan01_00569 [Folsomia candida]
MKYFALCLALAFAVVEINAHGRISDPVQRGSLWRHPEYEYANPGRQPDDYENFCGSRAVTDPFIGACGLCGDSILDPRPRKHEIGGEFERGIIVKTYNSGATIPVSVEIAAGHDGWYEFRLCDYSNTGVESEECFDNHLLRLADGSTRIKNAGNSVTAQVVLPAGLTCTRCVLQWHWYGDGSKQYYRTCSDIAIQ